MELNTKSMLGNLKVSTFSGNLNYLNKLRMDDIRLFIEEVLDSDNERYLIQLKYSLYKETELIDKNCIELYKYLYNSATERTQELLDDIARVVESERAISKLESSFKLPSVSPKNRLF